MTESPLDIEQPEALANYMRRSGRIGTEEAVEVRVLAGGVSNRTVLVRRAGGEAWVLKQALPRLRVEADWRCSPARIGREALGLRRLGELLPPGSVPALVFEDAREHLLAMEAVPEPHANWKTMLLAGQIEPRHVERFARLLAQIHRGGWQRRADWADEFADQSFFEALRLEPYYTYTGQQVPEAAAFLADLVATTRATRLTLVHGDFSPKNVLVCGERLVLLDHEVMHWGDPAFDLGFSLTHLLSKALHMPEHRQRLGDAARQYWAVYLEQLGAVPWRDALDPRAARHTLGCLLGRVAGRSPLEYLTGSERTRQQQAVLALMQTPPASVDMLIASFLERIAP